jgi:SAM-dependent methyltransferase
MDHKYALDYDDVVLAELYDRHETYTNDVELIRRLIGGRGPLNILECFCGTGRIALPLAQDGHRVTGIDAEASSPGGFLYLDDSDFDGIRRLAPQPRVVFDGATADGAQARYPMEELSFDDRAAILNM